MLSRQSCVVGVFVAAFFALLSSSFYHLYNAPIVGISVSWDTSDSRYEVASSTPWSLLEPGDAIQRIGTLQVGFYHLLTDNIHIHGRKELFQWLEVKKDLFQVLMKPPVEFTIERDGSVMNIPVTPRKAGLSFLGRLELLHLFEGIVFFLVGLIVFYKQKASERGIVFFMMCVALMLVFVTNATSLMSETVYDPAYLFLMNLTNIVSLLLGNAALLHFSLLLPRKRRFLSRFPALVYLFHALNIILAASLWIPAMNFCLAVYGPLAAAAVIQAFFSYREPLERQQMRWVGAGFVFGLAPWIFINALPMLVTGHRLMSDTIPAAFVVCIPLSMAFAIQKYRLLDIDALLEGTLVYIVTLLLLGVVDLAFMGLFASHFSESLAIAPAAKGFLIVALAIALYAALRDRVRTLLLKVFKRDRPDEAAILASFADRASGLAPEAVLETFAAIIQEAFQPRKVLAIDRGSREADSVLASFHGELEPVNLWERSIDIPPASRDFFVALPIGKGEEAHQVLLLGALPRGRFYSRHDMAILKALLTQAKVSYENALLYQENLKHHEARRIEEQRHMREKEKILKDLHDGIGGITTNISLLAELAQHKTTREEMSGALATIASLSRECLSEIRSFIQSLDPRDATWEALIGELRYAGGTMIRSHHIAFDMRTSCEAMHEEPGSLLFLNVFRVYKEALTNIVKHSKARSVSVVLSLNPENLSLSIRDDGIGLDHVQGRRAGRGMVNMKARAEEVGGRLRVESDKGTRVHLEIPLPVK